MGKILDEVRNEGEKRGRILGIEETKIISIQSLMKNLNLSLQQAMEVLDIPLQEREYYMKKV